MTSAAADMMSDELDALGCWCKRSVAMEVASVPSESDNKSPPIIQVARLSNLRIQAEVSGHVSEWRKRNLRQLSVSQDGLLLLVRSSQVPEPPNYKGCRRNLYDRLDTEKNKSM